MAGQDIEAALLRVAALAGKGDFAVAAAVMAAETTGCRDPHEAYRAWRRYRRRMRRTVRAMPLPCDDSARARPPG